ncbi:clp1-like protein [Mycena polygramma]|nr:clp1-like protein [Mycena polygramma]
MFQVASHPAAFPHRDSHKQHRRPSYDQPSRSTSAVTALPRNLERPPFTDISRDALAAAAPELAAVPAEFIRHGLRAKAHQMQAGIAALAPSHLPQSIPRSHLPAALTVPLRAPQPGSPASPSYPTHALAIAPPPKSSHSDRDAPQAIFPVHAVVLAAHCAKLPRLPPQPRAPSSAALTLPVLPLALPSPQAFAILHAYMYTHRLDAALASLLPFPPAFLESLSGRGRGEHPPAAVVSAALGTPAVRHTLAAHLYSAAGGGNIGALMAHAAHVKELWQDMVALGMYDAPLWDALDLAWEVVLGAMNLAAH